MGQSSILMVSVVDTQQQLKRQIATKRIKSFRLIPHALGLVIVRIDPTSVQVSFAMIELGSFST